MLFIYHFYTYSLSKIDADSMLKKWWCKFKIANVDNGGI